MIAKLYPVCYHECTAVNWRETLSPRTSYFTEGMTQAARDVRRTLAFDVAGSMSTSFPAFPLTARERREFLRGYAAGILQELSDTRPRDIAAPVTEEGAEH